MSNAVPTYDGSVNVFYSHNFLDGEKYSIYKEYVYYAIHVTTGQKFERIVYCQNKTDFLKLVDRWNYLCGIGKANAWAYTLA